MAIGHLSDICLPQVALKIRPVPGVGPVVGRDGRKGEALLVGRGSLRTGRQESVSSFLLGREGGFYFTAKWT